MTTPAAPTVRVHAILAAPNLAVREQTVTITPSHEARYPDGSLLLGKAPIYVRVEGELSVDLVPVDVGQPSGRHYTVTIPSWGEPFNIAPSLVHVDTGYDLSVQAPVTDPGAPVETFLLSSARGAPDGVAELVGGLLPESRVPDAIARDSEVTSAVDAEVVRADGAYDPAGAASSVQVAAQAYTDGQVSSEATTRADADTAEATARQQEDAALDGRISALEATTFDPRSLPGLAVWLDARYPDGKLAPDVGDGQPLGSWADLSGHARHAAQGTGAAQPLWQATGVNGHPALAFDGVDDALATASFTLPGVAMTVYYVYVGSQGRSFDQLGTVGDGGNQVGLSQFSDSAFLAARVDTALSGSAFNQATRVEARLGWDGQPHIASVAVDADAGTSLLAVDGVTATHAILRGTIAAFAGPLTLAKGDPLTLAAVLVYDRAHDDATRGRVERWLSATFGVPLAA